MKTLVVGLGNPVFRDDGSGILVARMIADRLNGRPDITVIETSAAGLDFMDLLTGYDKAIIIDAVKSKSGKPGQVYRFSPDMVQTQQGTAPHDIDLTGAIELGKRLGLQLPRDIVIFGIEAGDTSISGDKITPEVERAVYICRDNVITELQPELPLVQNSSVR